MVTPLLRVLRSVELARATLYVFIAAWIVVIAANHWRAPDAVDFWAGITQVPFLLEFAWFDVRFVRLAWWAIFGGEDKPPRWASGGRI